MFHNFNVKMFSSLSQGLFGPKDIKTKENFQKEQIPEYALYHTYVYLSKPDIKYALHHTYVHLLKLIKHNLNVYFI